MSQKGSGASRGNISQHQEFKVVIVGDRGCGKTSLLAVYTKGVFPEWYPEVRHFCDGVPIILVGYKADLRGDKALTKKLWSSGQNAVTYDLFREATKQATRAPGNSERRSLCAVL